MRFFGPHLSQVRSGDLYRLITPYWAVLCVLCACGGADVPQRAPRGKPLLGSYDDSGTAASPAAQPDAGIGAEVDADASETAPADEQSAALTATELLPVSLTFQTEEGASLFLEALPPGAVFDGSTSRLLWIPQRGQAGEYVFYSVEQSPQGAGRRPHRLSVVPISDARLRSGPPAGYADDEVGLIFVHGKGSQDNCADTDLLHDYWRRFDETVAPDAALRKLVCYNGRHAVATDAPKVARQILSANCGRANKCIIVTHSMGGLMINHMFTHARPARSGDPEPAMFAEHALYQQVRERTLFVISVASAAGGSKAADIVADGDSHSWGQEAVGALYDWFDPSTPAADNLVIRYATRVAAPLDADPGVPFFMVATYLDRVVERVLSGSVRWVFDWLDGDVAAQGLTALDAVVNFSSRSDGLVSFRSSCGVASDNDKDGPGHNADLRRHFDYCYRAPKKPNHFVWFASNVDHAAVLQRKPGKCKDCEHVFPYQRRETLLRASDYDDKTTGEVIWAELHRTAEPGEPRRLDRIVDLTQP